MLGSGKQSAYAAANAYLNALAEDRVRRGLRGTSLGWGLWGETGMAMQGDMLDHMQRHGLVPLAPAEAMTAFGRALGFQGSVLAADFDWSRFAQTFTLPRQSALLSELPEVRQALGADTIVERDAVVAEATLHEELTHLEPAERREALLTLVRSIAAELLGYGDGSDIEPAAGVPGDGRRLARRRRGPERAGGADGRAAGLDARVRLPDRERHRRAPPPRAVR